MRILAACPYYEPEGGGLERYAHEILRRFARGGHEVRALAFTRGEPRAEERGGVAVERLAPKWVLGNTPIGAGFRERTAEVVKDWEPEVLVAHAPVPYAAEMASLAARDAGVPVVVTFHAGQLRGSNPLLQAVALADRATLMRRMLRDAAGLVAVSHFVRDHALRAHRAKSRVVVPGVDAQVFRPGDQPAERSVLFVGPLDKAYRWKGVDDLWSAFRRLHKALPDVRLDLVGEGDRLGGLQARAKQQGLDGAVVFHGRLPMEDLVQAYQRAGVVVLPSTSDAESFGMVLAEANACGRPVVGTRVGGIPEFVKPGDNGLLVEPGAPRDLADALRVLLRDPELSAAMGRRGRARVIARHDWDLLAERTEEFLHDTVRRSEDARGAAPGVTAKLAARAQRRGRASAGPAVGVPSSTVRPAR